jgi:hypothetical protein
MTFYICLIAFVAILGLIDFLWQLILDYKQAKEIIRNTPPNCELRRLAEKFAPPQEFYQS